MDRVQLIEAIDSGENSRVAFKRDDVSPVKLAAEMAALLNLRGGRILLGVEDNGSVSGLVRDPKDVEDWIMRVSRDKLQPAPTPMWQELRWNADKRVGVMTLLANNLDKPYKIRQGSSWVTKVRVGSTTRDATREEEERLYQESGGLRYGLKPVHGSIYTDLDDRRLRNYFIQVRGDDGVPAPTSDEWERILCNLELMTEQAEYRVSTIDGMLLFGSNVGRYVPQSGVRALCYMGSEPDYAISADKMIKGPMVRLDAADGSTVETGVVERTIDFIRRNTGRSSTLESGRRVDRLGYPEEAVREIVVNALVHRDYSIAGTDVMLSIFEDRLEVRSPGRLPNTITVESIRSGARYARNQNLMNIMRDYGYVDSRGMGVRNKVLPAMRAHNGTEPDFIEREHDFTVVLRKRRPD